MKKSILFAGLLMVSAMFIGCNNDHSPETSTTKLWPAAVVSKDADGIQKAKYGYIDQKGNFAIPASYLRAYEFSCGLALVRVSESSLFFVDEKNNMQVGPDFEAINTYFYYDHVTYRTSSQLNGMLNKNFEIVLQPAYYGLGSMTEAGLVVAKQNSDSKVGYVNKDGEWKIPATYDGASGFVGSNAVVQMGDNYGVINKSGDWTIGLQSKWLTSLGADRIGFYDPDSKKYGMMDVKGNIISQAIYDVANGYGFDDADLMAVAIDNKWGYVDKNAKQVLPLQYYYATPFLGGIGFVMRAENANWEAIDDKGKTLFTCSKDEGPEGGFVNGLCLLEKYTYDEATGKAYQEYRYVDEKGATVYSWRYERSINYAPGKKGFDLDRYMAPTKYGYRTEKL